MALEPIQLDDLTWSDLTTTARDRIPAVSNRQWTLHAPVDPGITLLELFAAQFDQRLYWMDQPSDAVNRGLLKLMGIRTKPVGIAATVLQLATHLDEKQSMPSGKIVVLPAGAMMRVDNEAGNIVFSTAQDVAVLPVQPRDDPAVPAGMLATRPRLDLIVGGEDKTLELQSGAPTCLLPATGYVRETDIVLWLKKKKVGKAGFCGLLFELETPSQIEPQWLADFRGDEACYDKRIAVVEPPARIRWLYSSGKGETFSEFDPRLVQDGTGGLRRSGIVRLPIPRNPYPPWAYGEARHNNDGEYRPFTIRIRAENPSFSFVPRVRSIVPNAVIARHTRPVRLSNDLDDHDASDEVARQIFDWRPLPGNELILPDIEPEHLPVPQTELNEDERCLAAADEHLGRPRRLPQTVRLKLRERDGEHTWVAVDDLTKAGPADRYFVADREQRRLQFGDGLTGRVPIPLRCVRDGLQMEPGDPPAKFTLEYEVGGGSRGNFANQRIWKARSPSKYTGRVSLTAVNVVAAEGGAEPESLETAVRRAETELRRRYRAVTPDDIESLAVATPDAGIQRAYVAVGFLPDYPCMPIPGAATVFIVPGLPESLGDVPSQTCGEDLIALQPDAGALDAVRRHLDRARLVTQEIQVHGPDYAEVELEVDIAGEPLDAQVLRKTVADRLHRFLHPLFGDDEARGWPFGKPLRPSELTRVVQLEIGEDFAVTRVGIRLLSQCDSTGEPTVAACPVPPEKSIVISCPPQTGGTAPESPAESCEDVKIGPHQLVALRSVSVAITLADRTTGGLL